ncbi:hypothetical protein [Metallosphaera hakonensis]|uniref:Uncharacterized protein n=1 Tax=Metallosphaera hakonensis JCM 8857 = DSM 7519 TaxID=1293036 RepID=A0A2U9IRQ8_9CREN|nr:hypothetical protein [Metallosphaera hakonensis]AWR98722.1 hypothetical protein DFR87_02360 [Metallosphaera hakonensis JCM 8857 = DSM 7519]
MKWFTYALLSLVFWGIDFPIALSVLTKEFGFPGIVALAVLGVIDYFAELLIVVLMVRTGSKVFGWLRKITQFFCGEGCAVIMALLVLLISSYLATRSA